MLTIDNLPLEAFIKYAQRTQYIEQINRTYRFSEAVYVPSHLQVLDTFARAPKVDILLGIVRGAAPWALFAPPPNFFRWRRFPFNRFRAAPSLGTLEKQAADRARVEAVLCDGDEENEQKQDLRALFEEFEKINGWVSYITGRIAQFLQG